jgi:hypothetical protein
MDLTMENFPVCAEPASENEEALTKAKVPLRVRCAAVPGRNERAVPVTQRALQRVPAANRPDHLAGDASGASHAG